MPDWFAMRQFSTGGCASASILGEVLLNLDQDNHASELEDLLGLGFRHDDHIEFEVSYDDAIDANEKTFF